MAARQPVFYDNGKWKQGLKVSQNPNPDLHWEKSTEFNVGIDWSVFGDRLGGTIDVYHKKTTGMLWEYDVPSLQTFITALLANVGKMRNMGIEIAVNAVPVRTRISKWKTTVTVSHNENKLLALSNGLYETANQHDDAYLGEPISLFTQRLEVGKQVGNWYGNENL